MKTLNSFAELSSLDDTSKLEYSLANNRDLFSAEIERVAKEYKEKIEAEKNIATDALAKANQSVEDLQKAQAELDQIKAELNTIKQAQANLEAQTVFNDRMSALDAEYELDEEDRASLASDIKDLDEAGFEKFVNSFKKYAKNKSKAFLASLNTSTASTSTASDATVVADALDNATTKEGQTVPNTATASEKSLEEKYKDAFSKDNVSVSI
jgi:multidrug efflux pump subunit AcrA (membrane-fusion protein)